MWGVMAVGGTQTVRSPSPQVACSHPSVGFCPLPEGLWGLGVYLGWQPTPFPHPIPPTTPTVPSIDPPPDRAHARVVGTARAATSAEADGMRAVTARWQTVQAGRGGTRATQVRTVH